ncbi:MAG: protein kinase [Deltaproteobacteria bacterium]|nr:protein kinase [Deltaproteobacteria bacterium]MDQ3297934.1 protein kinase [Myxococcota bacterium]
METQHTVGNETSIGSYRLLKRIGAGGMGEVWLAEHTLLGRRAAVKLLHPMFSGRAEIVSRFFNEARAATAIADPGIVQIFDFGHHTDGTAYIVMELLEGETLDARWRARSRLAYTEAVRIVRQVAASLGAAHARGIVHRDLKPENIFLVADAEVPGGERAKILDFGIAKLGAGSNVKTQTSAVMGTPAFMSPEQCRGASLVDARSDVYALGCVLFNLMAGRPPFEADGTGDLIILHVTQPAPRLSSVVPSVPPAVDDLVARCLAKDPAQRYASGTELAVALGGLLGNTNPTLEVSVAQLPAVAIATPTTLSGSARGWERAHQPSRRIPKAVVGISIIATIVGFGVWRVGGAEQTPPRVAPVTSSEATLDAAPEPPPRIVPVVKPVPTAVEIEQVLEPVIAWSPAVVATPVELPPAVKRESVRRKPAPRAATQGRPAKLPATSPSPRATVVPLLPDAPRAEPVRPAPTPVTRDGIPDKRF